MIHVKFVDGNLRRVVVIRLFNSCIEMINETVREVFSRGQIAFDKTVQGREVDRIDYEAKELLGYCYTLTNFEDLASMLAWARDNFNREHLCVEIGDAWFNDMLIDKNPDDWWKKSSYLNEYWKKFGLHSDGTFSYTYGHRISDNIKQLIEKLKENLYSRGAVVSVWDRHGDLMKSRIGMRVPCTLTYHFIVRKDLDGDKINLFVNQRSCDLVNFFALDVYKAVKLLQFVVDKLEIKKGSLIHYIDSLHAYKIDVPEERKW